MRTDNFAGLFASLIAGPCSAETRSQVLETAEGLAGLPLSYFRAGIWKPRTQPGAFEGIGDEGLPWLQEVRTRFGFKICTEVATAEHVRVAVEHQLDMVWIGARSTVNPFTVQELAEALQGTGIPIMVKNPVNPDLKLWLGAIERLERHGQLSLELFTVVFQSTKKPNTATIHIGKLLSISNKQGPIFHSLWTLHILVVGLRLLRPWPNKHWTYITTGS